MNLIVDSCRSSPSRRYVLQARWLPLEINLASIEYFHTLGL